MNWSYWNGEVVSDNISLINSLQTSFEPVFVYFSALLRRVLLEFRVKVWY